MKKKIWITAALFLAAGLSLALALRSLEGVNKKIELTADAQQTMEIKLTPTPEPTPTPTPLLMPDDPAIPVLTLAADTYEMTVGQPFDVVSQVADITDDKDDYYTLFRRIQVQGVFDLNVPGEYTLIYFVTDTDGNASPQRELKLIVKAAQ